MPSRRFTPAWLSENIALRVALYYAVLTLAAMLLWPHLSPDVRHKLLDSYAPALNADVNATFTAVTSKKDVAPMRLGEPAAYAVAGATTAAFLLALPVAWIYMLTRERKGYRQTVVHTLVLLPVVVAGVVVLVKSSLSLAFSLAGIVAAVRFRNSLDDSKDAVFLFLVTGLGLAAGVEIDVAIVLSVLFNVVTLTLFYTDFARTPPGLEGERAQRQLERATAIANRTSQFVARVDEEVLRSLGPAQLDALATRVRKRREDTAPDVPPPAELEYDARLRITTTDPDALRPLVEPLLEARVKRWRLVTVERGGQEGSEGGGVPLVAYQVRWKKGTLPNEIVSAVRDGGAPYVLNAEVV